MKQWGLILLAACVTLQLAACTPDVSRQASVPESMGGGASQQLGDEDSQASDSAETLSASGNSEPQAAVPSVADNGAADVDLSDLESVTAAYVTPLIPSGPIWSYSWKSPSEMKADDLLLVLGFNNYLNLPKDFEGCYLPEDSHQPADTVETAIQKHFDVTGDYLKTSQYYNAADDTYALTGGFGGGWQARATSVEQVDNHILKISVGCAMYMEPENPFLTGLLTVDIGGTDYRYVSYEVLEDNSDKSE